MTNSAADFPFLPFSEAIESLKNRGQTLTPTAHWTEMWHSAHSTAFTVARSAGYDILGDIHGALAKAQEQGLPFRDFAKELTPILQSKGWWGRAEDGAQLGSPRRLRTIYDVNMRTSAARGNFERQQRLKDERPFLQYVALEDGKTRPLHKSWHGTVLHIDDPWWQTHYPPNGWGCRCGAEDLSQDDLDRFGYKLSPKAPDDGTTEWKHPVTGEIRQVPSGIDPGFDYHVGASAQGQAAQAAKVAMEKIAALPPHLGAAAGQDMAFALPQMERELAPWFDSVAQEVANVTFHGTGERRIMGAFPPIVLDFLREKGVSLATAAISMSDKDLLHSLRTVKVDPLPVETWKRLPTLLAEPEAIYWDLGKPGVIYVVDSGAGKIIVLVNYSARVDRKQMLINTVRSGAMLKSLNEFEVKGRYAKIYKK